MTCKLNIGSLEVNIFATFAFTSFMPESCAVRLVTTHNLNKLTFYGQSPGEGVLAPDTPLYVQFIG